MFSDSISEEDQKILEESRPLYTVSFDSLPEISLHRFFHKDTEEFEHVWERTNVPNRDQFFYQQFPKKATSLDSEHHYSNFNMYGYCSRWLPAWMVSVLFPFQKIITSHKRQLHLKGVPTVVECDLCTKLSGIAVWDRKGHWTCMKSPGIGRTRDIDLDATDEQGFPFFFKTYNDYIRWKSIINQQSPQSHQSPPEVMKIPNTEIVEY